MSERTFALQYHKERDLTNPPPRGGVFQPLRRHNDLVWRGQVHCRDITTKIQEREAHTKGRRELCNRYLYFIPV